MCTAVLVVSNGGRFSSLWTDAFGTVSLRLFLFTLLFFSAAFLLTFFLLRKVQKDFFYPEPVICSRGRKQIFLAGQFLWCKKQEREMKSFCKKGYALLTGPVNLNGSLAEAAHKTTIMIPGRRPRFAYTSIEAKP